MASDDIINPIPMTHQRMMWLRNRIRKKIGYEQGGAWQGWKDNIDFQWVDKQLKYILEGVVLEKKIMLRANDVWRRYGEDN